MIFLLIVLTLATAFVFSWAVLATYVLGDTIQRLQQAKVRQSEIEAELQRTQNLLAAMTRHVDELRIRVGIAEGTQLVEEFNSHHVPRKDGLTNDA
jgi:Skp family chaperone for outer membrane proteins